MAEHRRTGLVLVALTMAVGRRPPPARAISPRARGAQYASHDYRAAMERYAFRVSMSRKGNCWDNAVMERFFGSLKSEWLTDRRYATRTQARRDVIEYIEMEYNSCRLHSTLGYQ